jgi:phenylacetate-coenzyme A ligase PaaK-like adenylate-forming protein
VSTRTDQFLTAWQSFLETSLQDRLARHLHKDSESLLMALFHTAIQTVPAYRAFLATHGIRRQEINSIADFHHLPLMTKQNYMHAYSLEERCRNGEISGNDMLAVSSGSTGTPMIWPRNVLHELDIAFRFEQLFHVFLADQRSTLAVVCFAMGSWVGGMYTAACCRHLAAKGYPITTVTPGNKKDEILRIVKELGPFYTQLVLLGYPPYIKDIIDSGRSEGIVWSRYQPKLVFAGEVFSEEWRELLCERIGASDPATATASLYGTADAGVLGNETPLSIRIRKFFASRPDLARNVFGESRLPSLVQYDPASRYFEVHNGTLVVSGDNGVPLVRYHIADKGGIISYEDMTRIIADAGGDQAREIIRNDERGVWNMPFVHLFGRADFTVSYFGANVYPENISVGLEQTEVRDWVSGKFVLEVVETTDRNEALNLVVELLPGVAGDETMCKTIAKSVVIQLRRLNSEFANYVPPEYQTPLVTLKSHGDPKWFPIGVKHRYTRKA